LQSQVGTVAALILELSSHRPTDWQRGHSGLLDDNSVDMPAFAQGGKAIILERRNMG
jgi:hypothetical protein